MAHYFDEQPAAGHQVAEMAFRLLGSDFRFQTDRAVFSRQRLDFGSECLVKAVIKDLGKPRGRMLDLGCGYGPVGIIMKRLFPALEVVLCDINERALELARINARKNQAGYLEIVRSDALGSLQGDFDLILTNPPIRAGKPVVYRFFREASQRLRPGGLLFVVIRKQQGAPSALKFLRECFIQAEVIGHAAGYWVLKAGPVAGKTPDVLE